MASLKGWSLLLSALPGWRLDSLFCGDALSQLSPHLSATAVEERAAAGEAIALLFSMSGLSSLEEANDAEGQSSVLICGSPLEGCMQCHSAACHV